jgi:hypothetical protein
MFRRGITAIGGRMIPSQFSLCETNFGCMDIWEINPEGLGLFWMKASATYGEIILTEGLHDWEVSRPCPF